MIAVIADDFTGAAELAGITLRYGLTIQLAMPGIQYSGADAFIVSTDSRSLNKEAAIEVTANVIKDILKIKPEFIYKKIDSVLRGYVLDELNTQMEITGLNKAFVLPANPSLNRIIKDGSYYIGGEQIHKTGFATDPEFAITDPSVLNMIRAKGEERVLGHESSLPSQGIVIGEASTVEDVAAWAEKINNDWVIGGAGDFFTALLEKRYTAISQPEAVLELPHLFVSGTSFDKSKQFIKRIGEQLNRVAYLSASDEEWLDEISRKIKEQRRCVMAIPGNTRGISAQELRSRMAVAAKKIIRKENIKEIFIEGGSTAAEIMSELDAWSFSPVNELQRGVVRMKTSDLYITVKPGSYELPPQIIELYR